MIRKNLSSARFNGIVFKVANRKQLASEIASPATLNKLKQFCADNDLSSHYSYIEGKLKPSLQEDNIARLKIEKCPQ